MGGKRLRKLFVPYLFWSIIYIVKNGDITALSVKSLVAKLLFGTSQMQMYFVIVLIELTIVASLFAKILLIDSKWKYLPFLITPIYYVLIIYTCFFKLETVHFTLGRNLIAWFSYYYLGMLLASDYIKASRNRAYAMTITGFIISIFESAIFAVYCNDLEMAVTQLKISSFIFACGVIMLCEYYHKNRILGGYKLTEKIMVRVGDISYGIFFLHPFVLSAFDAIAKKIGIYDIALPVYQGIQLISTLVICALIITIVKKLDGRNRIRWMIGF